MIRKVIIDTNILVSSLLTSNEDSATVQVVKLMLRDSLIPVFC